MSAVVTLGHAGDVIGVGSGVSRCRPHRSRPAVGCPCVGVGACPPQTTAGPLFTRWLLAGPLTSHHPTASPTDAPRAGADGHRYPRRPRSSRTRRVRLVTTLRSPQQASVRELIEIYHERWEVELVMEALATQHRLVGRPAPQPTSHRCAPGVIGFAVGALCGAGVDVHRVATVPCGPGAPQLYACRGGRADSHTEVPVGDGDGRAAAVSAPAAGPGAAAAPPMALTD